MNPPKIPEYSLHSPIGEGSTGSVWSASYQDRGRFAIKALKGLAINRQLLSDALVRVYSSAPHPGVIAIRDFDLASPQAYIAMELCAEEVRLADGRRVLRPRNLESLCGALPSDEAWKLLMQAADGLAFLHRKRIIHCNVKPSNLLLDGADSPRVKVADFAQGMLGGIEQIDPGESLFYAPPEQLRDADHFFEGRGELWDVYSFGATAYHLLTGDFPRLNSAIADFRKQGARQLDLHRTVPPEQVADALEQEPEIRWPTEASSELETRRRHIVETCLCLKPDGRHVDMREVLDALREAVSETEHRSELAGLELERDGLARSAQRAKRRARTFGAGAAAAAGVAAFALYNGSVNPRAAEETPPPPAPAPAPETPDPPEEDPATIAERQARMAAEVELAGAVDDLRHSQDALDQIFAMIAARDGEGNPLYDVPEGTLGTVLNYYDELVARHRDKPEMKEPLTRALDNGGQLHMMLGDSQEARSRFREAAELSGSLEVGGGDAADVLVRRASIFQNLSDAESACGLPRAAVGSAGQANEIFSTLAGRDPSSATASRALARSSLQLARKMADSGQNGEAGIHIDRAERLLEKLEEENQINEDDLFLLAGASFERGRVERALGNREDAIKSQIESIDRFLGLLDARPDVPSYRFQLARAYGEAADLAARLGEISEAQTANEEAAGLLRSLADSNADKPAYRFELARRMRADAARLRDAGKGDKARAEQEKALILLEDLHQSFPENARYAYEFAIVSGIQSDLFGEAGKGKEAVGLGRRSVELMQELLNEDLDLERGDSKRPRYRRALAALYGKLGHHTERLGEQEKAMHCFEKSLRQYLNLTAANPDDKSAAEGVSWAEKRIARLR